MRRWEDSELDLIGLLRESRRLLARARRRWIVWLLTTLALTALLSYREYTKQRLYSATVVLSITEGEHADNAIAHANSRLQDYVYYAVFTDGALNQLIEKYQYRPDLMKKNPRLALEQFRDFIDITIYKNEFTQPRYRGGPPRSARLAIGFKYTDPETAVDIARDLGDMVVNRDAENRRLRLEAQQRIAADAVNQAEADVNRLSRRQAEVDRDLTDALLSSDALDEEIAILRVEQASHGKAIEQAIARLKDATTTKKELDLRTSADQESLELRYDRVEWGAPQLQVDIVRSVAKTAVGAFIGLFLVLGLVIGAFDPRVYDERDVRRLGLRALGVMRPRRRLG